MAEIIKIYKERIPKVRFIGKCYKNADRGSNGSYAGQWMQWFNNGWFALLEALVSSEDIDTSYLALERCNFNEPEDTFEYWIGMFLPPEAQAPEGFDIIELKESDAGICWIKGKEDGGDIYKMHDECVKLWQENGMGDFKHDEEGRVYFFERYNCPRFTEKDAEGYAILDYGVYLK